MADLKPGSLDLILRPDPVNERVPKDVMPRIVKAIATGLAALERKAERPPYFSDKALERVRELGQFRSDVLPTIEVRGGNVGTRLTDTIVAHAALVLAEPLTEFGTVEGRLEAVNLHGDQRQFVIFDPLTNRRIECLIGHRIPPDKIGEALEKRVAVSGLIKYRENGEILNVSAQELEIFPSEEDLPSADEVRGILA